MKLARTVLIGVAVVAMAALLSSVSFAQETKVPDKDSAAWKAKHEATMKVLQDSAAALQQTNPDLAKQLSDIVNNVPGKEKPTKEERQARREARVKIYKAAAAALQSTRPDLAKSLEDLTVSKHRAEQGVNK